MAELDVTRATRPLDESTVAAVNEVLAGERGSVLALVQLAAMATDALERHALIVTGGQAAQVCIDLHALLARHGALVSERVGDAAYAVQQLERLDERYAAFGQLQQRLMALIEASPTGELDAAAQAALAMAHTVLAAHAAWALQRARDFATSREDVPPARTDGVEDHTTPEPAWQSAATPADTSERVGFPTAIASSSVGPEPSALAAPRLPDERVLPVDDGERDVI